MKILQYILFFSFMTIFSYLILFHMLYAKIRMSTRLKLFETQKKGKEIDVVENLSFLEKIGKSLNRYNFKEEKLILRFSKSRIDEKMSFDKYIGLLLVIYSFIFVITNIIVATKIPLIKSMIFSFLFVLFMSTSLDKIIVSNKIKKRVKIIEKEMSEYFSLLSITIEAGLGLDVALQRVSNILKGELAYEFDVFIKELNMGVLRKEAYSHLNSRIDLPLFKEIISNIETSEKSGAPIAHVLRVQSKIIQDKQAFLAREKAMKAPIKMMFPMILFIFPVLIIFTMVPALLKLL